MGGKNWTEMMFRWSLTKKEASQPFVTSQLEFCMLFFQKKSQIACDEDVCLRAVEVTICEKH